MSDDVKRLRDEVAALQADAARYRTRIDTRNSDQFNESLRADAAVCDGYARLYTRAADALEAIAAEKDPETMGGRMRLEERAAASVLQREGWRFCDIPTCNCNSWHRPADGLDLASIATRARRAKPLSCDIALVDPGVDDWTIVTLKPDDGFIGIMPGCGCDDAAARQDAALRLIATALALVEGK